MGFGKAVGCAAFWWRIGGGNANCRGVFLPGVCWTGQYSSKKAQFLFHATQDQKMTPTPQNGIPRASKISN